ncbi:putative ec86 protein [Phaeoacremonium minimum UCRPA7]|uniref:Putative ec86 protein n=1 Tax=Phaeoacremonium minimum (strain UCR-PA7) TaxID=1286976 RepID=R8BDB7_PHAM7|nr:putative ec86 protein [Phaeoacremonium minimum UCRPA7]EON97298.1 putative ec86 protein [Phaeoacremonium minimum UCRPA7]
MRLAVIIAAVVGLALGARATAARRQTSDPHIADFRTFGETGCFRDNQGIWTFTQSDLTGCKTFPDDLLVKSLFAADYNDGCGVFVYTDTACSVGDQSLGVGGCLNDYSTGLKSYIVKCE